MIKNTARNTLYWYTYESISNFFLQFQTDLFQASNALKLHSRLLTFYIKACYAWTPWRNISNFGLNRQYQYCNFWLITINGCISSGIFLWKIHKYHKHLLGKLLNSFKDLCAVIFLPDSLQSSFCKERKKIQNLFHHVFFGLKINQ